MYRTLSIFLASILCVFASSVQAQYVGPDSAGKMAEQTINVASILKSPVDDQPVVLRGYITQKVGKEKYMFSDGTGKIRVEIDAHDFPSQRVDEKTLVEIQGEVEADFMESPEIDAKRVTVVTPSATNSTVRP